jgi:hypothetical protein
LLVAFVGRGGGVGYWSCATEVMLMTTNRADQAGNLPAGQSGSVDELFCNVPAQSARDLICDGIFDTDEELDEFLTFIYAERRANLA